MTHKRQWPKQSLNCLFVLRDMAPGDPGILEYACRQIFSLGRSEVSCCLTLLLDEQLAMALQNSDLFSVRWNNPASSEHWWGWSVSYHNKQDNTNMWVMGPWWLDDEVWFLLLCFLSNCVCFLCQKLARDTNSRVETLPLAGGKGGNPAR